MTLLAYVEQVLVPTLRPGDSEVMDNLGYHKQQASHPHRRCQALFPAALLYSPNLNPIEQVFAKLKPLRAKSRRATITIEARWKRAGVLLDAFTAAECANYFKNADYAAKLGERALA